MIELKVNYNQIRARLDAAEKLQEAGEEAASRQVIRKLAADILEGVKE